MSTQARPAPHRVHRLERRVVVWLLVALVAAAGIGVDRVFLPGQAQPSWPPKPCVVRGIDARCGTFAVPENRAKPNGHTIGLHVVVVPAFTNPARSDAVAYLAGGPGDAATEQALDQGWQSSKLNLYRDILLVDQRGTGESNPGDDVIRYGTRMAMDDMDAVRSALGYRELDVIGSSYGATAAQNGMTGDELASIVHAMLLDLEKAVSIPLVISRAAQGDNGPLEQAGSGGLDADLNLMGSSIWCNEPWTGLDGAGPWGTDFDSYTTARIAAFRHSCSSVPRRVEPRSLWTLPTASAVPVLAFVGGADPQDPVTNLSDLKQHFPDSRTVIFPHIGHQWGIGGCFDQIVTDFVDVGTTKGLDTTGCDGAVVVPPFTLTD